MTQVAPELLAQNMKAKDAVKAIKFNFKEFSTDVNGYAVSLINNNTALVIDIDHLQAVDANILQDIADKKVFAFAIKNSDTYEYARLVVPADGSAYTLDSRFQNTVVPSNDMKEIAKLVVEYIADKKDQLGVEAEELAVA